MQEEPGQFSLGLSLYIAYLRSLPILCFGARLNKMFYVHCLMLIIFSVASGSEDHSWREEIEKRLSVLEESNIQLKKENKELKALILTSQNENKRLKSELKDLRERVSNCEGLIHRQNVDTEIVSQNMETNA